MIRCIAIDDEPLALKLIESYCNQIPQVELVASCLNPLEATALLQQGNIDLLLLDIQMPDISGLQFINALKEKPLIILTTAYKQYAVESYDFNVVDYLLKPFSIDRFLKSINKAKEICDLKNKALPSPNTISMEEEFIFVHADYKLLRVNIKDILFIEGYKDYVKIHVSNSSKPILTIMRIKTFEEKLPAENFVRTHRSFLINFNKIASIRKNRITIGDKEIPVGDLYAENFYRMVERKNWGS